MNARAWHAAKRELSIAEGQLIPSVTPRCVVVAHPSSNPRRQRVGQKGMGMTVLMRDMIGSGEDPTGAPDRQRLVVRLSHDAGTREAIDALLDLPGVATAARSEAATILLDVAPDVVSSDEIRTAVELTGASISEIRTAEREHESSNERGEAHHGP